MCYLFLLGCMAPFVVLWLDVYPEDLAFIISKALYNC
jgi:hypothetical protein